MASTDPGVHWNVGPDEAGVRLDKFLAHASRLGARRPVAKAIAAGKVFLNGVEAGAGKSGARLSAGDTVRVWMDRPGSARRFTAKRIGEVPILFEDESLIVLNK